MSDIKINKVTGGASGGLLIGCIFRQRGGSTIWDFYASDGTTRLASNVTAGSFDFSLGVFDWTMTLSAISASAAAGTWTNNRARIPAEEEGTFQAQAGGHVGPEPGKEEEAASSASAST